MTDRMFGAIVFTFSLVAAFTWGVLMSVLFENEALATVLAMIGGGFIGWNIGGAGLRMMLDG